MTLRIGLRREEKILREKRAPLIPSHVRELISGHGLSVSVEASTLRVFGDEDYRREGARITGDLSDCDIIVASQGNPPDEDPAGKSLSVLLPHGQGPAQNMPMLRRLIGKKCTLIDYEKIVDRPGPPPGVLRQAGRTGGDDRFPVGPRPKAALGACEQSLQPGPARPAL